MRALKRGQLCSFPTPYFLFKDYTGALYDWQFKIIKIFVLIWSRALVQQPSSSSVWKKPFQLPCLPLFPFRIVSSDWLTLANKRLQQQVGCLSQSRVSDFNIKVWYVVWKEMLFQVTADFLPSISKVRACVLQSAFNLSGCVTPF